MMLFLFFYLNDTVINCEDNVTLLRVNIDFMLTFNDHISDICTIKSISAAGSA